MQPAYVCSASLSKSTSVDYVHVPPIPPLWKASKTKTVSAQHNPQLDSSRSHLAFAAVDGGDDLRLNTLAGSDAFRGHLL